MKKLKSFNLAERAYKHRNALTTASMVAAMSIQMVGATDIWGKVNSMTQEIYLKVLGISTGLLVVVVAIAMVMRMASKNPSSIEVWTGWAKNAAISWAILNGLGFALTYARTLFAGGGEVTGVWGG